MNFVIKNFGNVAAKKAVKNRDLAAKNALKNAVKKIAIVRVSSLGDIIVSVSFLAYLKSKINCQITWIVEKRFADILANSPLIDSLISLDLKSDFWGIVKTLRRLESFDCVIDFQGLIKSGVITFLLKSPRKFGFDFRSAKEGMASIFYHHKATIKYEENILLRHLVLLNLVLESFGVKGTKSLENMLKNRSRVFGFSTPFALSKTPQNHKKILLILESSKPNKEYKNFGELLKICAAQPFSFFVIFNNNESYAAELTRENKNAILLPRMSLDAVKSVVAQMDLVIGGDTGLTHLAWAQERPSITLFGATPKERFRLIGTKNKVIAGSKNPNYNPKDFSINSIKPAKIFSLIQGIL